MSDKKKNSFDGIDNSCCYCFYQRQFNIVCKGQNCDISSEQGRE